MIRTKNYILVKSRKMPITNRTIGKWTPVKEYGDIETYSLKDAKAVKKDLENGEIEGHSKNCIYKIMEICYCDIGKAESTHKQRLLIAELARCENYAV